jgi:hypothetical protein
MNGLVKVVSKERGAAGRVRGYVTMRKFVEGRTPAELEKMLGFDGGTFKDGVYVMTVEPPPIDGFELKGYSNTPGGEPFVPGISDERWPPGAGAPQWNLTTEVNVTDSKFVGVGENVIL